MPTRTLKKRLSVIELTLDLAKVKKVKSITKAKNYNEAVDNALKIVIDNDILHKSLFALKGKGNIKDVYNRVVS